MTYTVDLSSSIFDVNTYYPVIGGNEMTGTGFHRLKCSVELNSGSKPSWSTHDCGFTANLELLVTRAGWGTTVGETLVLHNYACFTTSNSIQPIGYSQMNNSSRPVFWLRGGGKYFIKTSYSTSWAIATSSTTYNNQTVAPVTSYPGVQYSKAASEGSWFISSSLPYLWGPYTLYNVGTRL